MRARYLLAFLPLVLASGAVAQPPLPTERIEIQTPKGPHAFTVEVAADDASREAGLMFRTKMAPDAGMLFDFKTPQPTQFWMENTVLPLDMLFVRADGTIANIKADAVPYSRQTIPSAGPVLAVIELNAGRAAALGIRPGDRVMAPEFPRR